MTTQDILTQLKAVHEQLPDETLTAAIADREQIIPELLQLIEQLIEQAKKDPEDLWDRPDYRAPFYAMYLLAQFREKQAYPLIIDFFSLSLDDEWFLEVTEAVLNRLGRILASVSGGDDSLIKNLIENEEAYQYARCEAISALVSLVASGDKSREEVLTYFKTLFQTKFKRDPSNRTIWEYLLKHSSALYPEELYDDIKQVYEEGLVESLIIGLDHIENQLALQQERVLKRLPRNYPLIDDAIAEIKKGIYAFKTEKDIELNDALVDLTINTGIFPSKALAKTITFQEQVTPRLLGLLENTEEHADEQRKKENNLMFHIYALYLLAQFREKHAYSIIIDLFSLPGDLSVDITGDVVTEDLPRILASVYDGNDTLLKNLIEDREINEYVRDAAIRTFMVLVASGQKTRDEVMTYFKTLFGKLEREMSLLWATLVGCCAELYPEEVHEDIQQVVAEELMEYFFQNPMTIVEETLALGQEKTLERLKEDKRYTLIDDTISEMQDWACFQKKKKKPEPLRYAKMREGPKVGRNEPCPCGSGKKYKKCCGSS
jgi:hypothetical protein